MKKRLRELEKRGFISRKPHPLFAFTLFFISVFLFVIVNKLGISGPIASMSKATVILSFLFALAHLIVVRILERTDKKTKKE